MPGWKEWKFRALTDIWTGDANRSADRLIPTGIMGSLRWWFEVLVRGLNGKACDPTAREVRCPQDTRKKPTDPCHHCVVCELFGCTGWARKFRLMILDDEGDIIRRQIKADQTFTLRFIPLRRISPEEWCLLDATLRLIADYGAIGGKTVFKPSDEQGRENVFHHRDFGLIKYVGKPEGWECNKTLDELRAYITDTFRWRIDIPYQYRENGRRYDYSWASLQNFWCVKGRYLARQGSKHSSFNRIIGRRMEKNRAQQLFQDTSANRWLAGRQQESKKVFSFKNPAYARRTFGFTNPGFVGFGEIKNRLVAVWQGFNPDDEFKTGEQILNELIRKVRKS